MKKEPILEIEDVDDSFLPKKDLFRIDEVAAYFSVEEFTVRRWIAHGHLKRTKIASGSIRVSRESILNCRFNSIRLESIL